MSTHTLSVPSNATDSKTRLARGLNGFFYQEGEYWNIGFSGNVVRLKDSKGLGYIAFLLRYPGAEFHTLDLASGIAGGFNKAEDRLEFGYQGNLERAGIHIGKLGDAGEILDVQAKQAYRQRLSELREGLEEAKGLGRAERAEQLEEEIDALTAELARAVALTGRSRRAASASERTRQAVTKSIRTAIERIARNDSALGDIFSRCIKTGNFCSYQPDPGLPIAWNLAAFTAASKNELESGIEAVLLETDTSVPPARSGLPTFAAAQRTGFVDRESESRVIRAMIDRGRESCGSVVMLAGGAGIGKTRLAAEMAEYAISKGFACFSGHCSEHEPFPYLPFVQVIETMQGQASSLEQFRNQLGDNAAELVQLVPSLHRVLPKNAAHPDLPDSLRRRYLFQGVAELLQRAAKTRPHLLILDDLHWADGATLALLSHLATRVRQLPLVIIAIFRDDYPGDSELLFQTLEELFRQGVRPIKLVGLPKDAVARMLSELSHRQMPETLVSTIFEQSNGNPLFVEELWHDLVERGKIFDTEGRFRTDVAFGEADVPENIRLVINRRLTRFGDAEMRVLGAAAVIGRSFSFQLLAAICQVTTDELFSIVDEEQRIGLLAMSSEPEKPLAFSHEMVRQTLLSGLSIARRQQLHAKVAAAIERLYPAGCQEQAANIAYHLLKAGAFAERGSRVEWLMQERRTAVAEAAFHKLRSETVIVP